MGEAKRTRDGVGSPGEDPAVPPEYFRYDIKGRIYYLRPTGLLQTARFARIISGIEIREFSGIGLFSALGDRCSEALAVLLIPAGTTPKEFIRTLKEPDGLQETIEWLDMECEPSQALEVLVDFLSCTQLVSLLEQNDRLWSQIIQVWEQRKTSTESAPLLQEEILVGETMCSP